MTSQYKRIKSDVLSSCLWLSKHGYLGRLSSGGNISVRVPGNNYIAITPSSRDYNFLDTEDICIIGFDKTPIEAHLSPSIETGMHISVYNNRPDVNAVLHTHQPFASVLSLINKPIPALFDEIVFEIGHTVDIIPYAFSGSSELAANVTEKLSNSCYCYLIQNHGVLCLGADINHAMKNAELLEHVAQIYHHALATGEKISKLPPSTIDYIAEVRQPRLK
jgi:L-ribulose-5-phosphate 4-epimerase